MKWAIFEFEDLSCDIGQTKWIQCEDAELFDNDAWFFTKEVVLKWPKDFNKALKMMQRDVDVDSTRVESERYSARVVKFGDDYNAMKSCLDTYVKTGKTDTPHKGRGHRLPVKNTRFESAHEESDDDGDDASPVKKRQVKKRKIQNGDSKKKNSLLTMIKNKYEAQKVNISQESDTESFSEEASNTTRLTSMEAELRELRSECTEMKKCLKHLTSTLSNITELPGVVKTLQMAITKLTALPRSPSSSRSSSPRPGSQNSSSPRPDSQSSSSPRPSSPTPYLQPSTQLTDVACKLIKDESSMVTLCPGIKVLPSQKELLSLHGTPKLFTYAVMEMVWSRDVLATHSLTGKMSNAHKDKDPKPSLDPVKVAAICDMVVNKFHLQGDKEVKAHIKAKLNNMERSLKLKK